MKVAGWSLGLASIKQYCKSFPKSRRKTSQATRGVNRADGVEFPALDREMDYCRIQKPPTPSCSLTICHAIIKSLALCLGCAKQSCRGTINTVERPDVKKEVNWSCPGRLLTGRQFLFACCLLNSSWQNMDPGLEASRLYLQLSIVLVVTNPRCSFSTWGKESVLRQGIFLMFSLLAVPSSSHAQASFSRA